MQHTHAGLDLENPASLDVEFPIRKSQVYLNHAGVAPLPRRAVEAMGRYASECSQGGIVSYPEWNRRIRAAREGAARLIGAEPGEIAFVKNTTHGLMIVAQGLDWKPGDVVVVEERPFPANWYPWKGLERLGVQVWQWPERDFRFHLEDLEARLKAGGVRLVSVCSAHYATGYRHSLAEIGSLCHNHDALFCVDAIQSMGAFPILAGDWNIDFLAADGHKWLLGPDGCGVLYCPERNLSRLGEHVVGWEGRAHPMDYDTLDQPPAKDARRFEEGALNLAGIHALGASMGLLNEVGLEAVTHRILENASHLADGLTAIGWELVSPRSGPERSGIVAVRHPRHDAARMASLLSHLDVHVVARRGFLRFSPHFYNTPAEVTRALEALEEATG